MYLISLTCSQTFLRPKTFVFPITKHFNSSLYSQTLTIFPNIIEKWELCNFSQKQISSSCKLRWLRYKRIHLHQPFIFLCPLLKLFSAGDPSQERNITLEVATSSLSTLAGFPWGSISLSKNLDSQEITTLDPPMRLQLFEFEACPFCRRVREAMTELYLSAEVYPCPKGSIRHRELVNRSGGKEQFPFLIDPNTGISM